jgi:hypothetical protein
MSVIESGLLKKSIFLKTGDIWGIENVWESQEGGV